MCKIQPLFSPNGSGVVTNEPLSFFQIFKILMISLQLGSSKEVLSNEKGIIMYWSRNMHEKQHVKPHIYCFVIFCKQFGYVFGTNVIVQEMLTLWSTCVQDGRAPP